MDEDRSQKTQVAGDDWILGLRAAPVTILEYGDFECPYCAIARPVLEGLVAEYPHVVRLVFRHFPLTTVHPHGLLAAEAAETAGALGRFWQMHDALFDNPQRLDYPTVRGYAEAIGVDVLSFDEAMQAHIHLPEVRRDFRRAIRDNVNGTPTIFINGQRYDGPQEPRTLLATIAALLPIGHHERNAGI